MKLTQISALGAIALLGLAAGAVQAQTVSSTVSSDATVQPTKLRAGASGTNFFNIEGSSNGANSSYGVVDFSVTALANPVGSVSSLTLGLFDAPAAFSANGNVDFYLATDTTTSISNATGASPLRFDSSATLPNGGQGVDVGTATGFQSSLFFLGQGAYTKTTLGNVESYTFTPLAGASSYLASQINNGGNIRIVAAADTSSVAATYVGSTSSTAADRPALTLTTLPAVPEPGALVNWGAGLGVVGVVLLTARRRRNA